MTEPEIVLLYKIPAGSLESLRVRSALDEMDIIFKEVHPDDTVRSLAKLASPDTPDSVISSSEDAAPAANHEPTAPEDFPESAMIFCGFSQERLKLAISRLREAGANPSCLKAVLTPINRDWRLCDLLAELIREREAFVQMRRQARTNRNAQNAAVPENSSS